MKKDIIGRDVPDNSLVIVMGKNKTTSKERSMRYGVLIGDAVFNEKDHQAAGEMVLVTNLDDEEIAIRDKILARLAKEKAESAKRAAERNRQVANLVGAIYQTSSRDDRDYYLYCGKKRVTVIENGAILSQETGHCYLKVYSNPTDAHCLTLSDFLKHGDHNISTYQSSWQDHFKVLKSLKKYHKELHQIDVPANFEMTGAYTTYKYDSNDRYGYGYGYNSRRTVDQVFNRKVIVEDVYN